MCGRYTLHLSRSQLAELVATTLPEDYAPDFNIGPGRNVFALEDGGEDATVRAVMHHWGLKSPQNFLINARIETADTTPRFRRSWSVHRCLLPANGFYEWFKDAGRKQPYYFRSPDGEPIFLAALYFPQAGPERQPACVVLTVEANEEIRRFHHRTPVTVPREAHADWLANRLKKADLIPSAASAPFAGHPVSQRVNRIRNNDRKLIEEVARPDDDGQMSLL